jgi:heme exporter protein B
MSIGAVLRKDAVSELRSKYAFSALAVFALTCLASMSMSFGLSIGGNTAMELHLQSAIQATLLWIIMFFSAMAGLGRSFVQEQDAGTLLTLKVYASPQAIYFGKVIFNVLLLVGLSVLVLPLFIIFFDVGGYVTDWVSMIGVLWLGGAGLAVISTMTAAMAAQAQGRSSLFTVLTFPLILPHFLGAISVTRSLFAGEPAEMSQFLFMGGYTLVALIIGSVLFDYLWVE